MVIRFQHIAAWTAFAFFLVAAAGALAAGVGTRLALWNATLGQYGIFPYSLCFAVAALAVGLVWAVTAFASGSGAGARYGVCAMLASTVLFWIPVRDFWLSGVVHAIPPLNDISTDSERAPEFLKSDGIDRSSGPIAYDGLRRIRFEGRSYAEEALQRLYYGEIKPVWQLGTTASKLYSKALSAADGMGWKIVATASDGRGGIIQATDTTLLFGLKDDIVVRVKPAGIGARLDIRSRSRNPGSDLGRNAGRICTYLKRLCASSCAY